MQMGRLAARLVIGGLFVGHGTQKLFGWFGGPGLSGTEQMIGRLSLHPTRAHALAAGITETAGGALLAVGAATPLAAAGLIGTMVTAVRLVHRPNGPWAANGGWEYNAVLVAALLSLVEAGPGRLSVDAARGRERKGTPAALAALGGGVGVSAAVVAAGRRRAPGLDPYASEGSAIERAVGEAAGDPVTRDE